MRPRARLLVLVALAACSEQSAPPDRHGAVAEPAAVPADAAQVRSPHHAAAREELTAVFERDVANAQLMAPTVDARDAEIPSLRGAAPRGVIAIRARLLESPLTRDRVLRVVRARKDGLLRCYERQLRRQPHLRGRIRASLTIDSAGKTRPAIAASLERHVDACVQRHLERLRFPEAARESRVRLLLVFKKAG